MKSVLVAAVLVVVLAASAAAQQNPPPSPETPGSPAADSGANDQPLPLQSATKTDASSANSKLHRWVDFQAGLLETRYRFVQTSDDVTTANQWQHKQTLKGAFKFDGAGRYTLQTLIGTGNSFTGSWDPTGVGTGAPTWDLHVRRLYAQAIPARGLELSAGSFDVLRGEVTEIVSYDNDAFMQGYRVSLKRPRQLFVDEISVTAGYLGDENTPNVFRRFKWMDDHNYTQALVAKRIGPDLSVSFDWTTRLGVSTAREGIKIGTKRLGGVVDDVRLELYQRVDAPEGQGWAFTANRVLSRRVTVNGGFADIDKDLPAFNGDRYLRGTRVFTGGAITIVPELVASVFYTHAFANDFTVANNQRLDLVLSYNVLKALQGHRAW
jgi:opacity protein-like surface antigen